MTEHGVMAEKAAIKLFWLVGGLIQGRARLDEHETRRRVKRSWNAFNLDNVACKRGRYAL